MIQEAEVRTLDAHEHRTTTHEPGTTARARGWSAPVGADEDGQTDDLDAAVAAARAGDEQGFTTVWRALHPPLLRYLRVRGDDAPEDLAAETWMHVVRSLRQFEGGAVEFRRWLFTIARHRAVDQARSRDRRPRMVAGLDSTLEAGSAPDTMPSVPSAENQVVDNEATERALDLLTDLPAAQAEMVALRFVAGLDVADVARLVGKKPGTVRVAVHRALRTLARDPRARAAREVV